MSEVKFDPLGDGISELSLYQAVGSDQSIIHAARASYAQEEDWRGAADEKLLGWMLEHEHGTPFENNSITFRVVLPMPIAVQWLRHRVGWSYNMLSRRFTSKDVQYYIPCQMFKQSDKNKQAAGEELSAYDYDTARDMMSRAYSVCEASYQALLAIGLSREQARLVLPQGAYTRFYATCNLRSAMLFYKLRQAKDAQWEIQQYAKAMGEIIQPLFPISWGHFLKELECST